MMEEAKMYSEIRRLSLLLAVAAVCLSIAVFPDSFFEIGFGIVIGCITGILGFNMIIHMSERITPQSENVKSGAVAAYTRRYGIYTLIFLISALRGVNILALLAGMMLHKGAIILYAIRHRKEDA